MFEHLPPAEPTAQIAPGDIADRYEGWRRQPPDRVPDGRFAALAGQAAWARLPRAIRRRFERKLGESACIAYIGEVTECRFSAFGWTLAQAARLIGAPLPVGGETGVPAIVTVSEDMARGGQCWIRQYGRHRGFPQVIHSVKCFSGPTGLEEYLGYGIGIALRLKVDNGALYFLSDHYFARLGRWRLKLPRWLSPGRLTIGHIDCGARRFAFTLELVHPLFGELVRQVAIFSDCEEASG